MGTDTHLTEQLLTVLRAFNVRAFEASPDGFVKIELFPASPDPVVINQVPADKKGKVEGIADTPYHKLFGGNMPSFRTA